MRLLTEQLRQQHRQIHALLTETAEALFTGSDTASWRRLQRLAGTVLGHIEFQRWALVPELARGLREAGRDGLADQAFAHARELEFIGHALKNLLEPLSSATTAPERISAEWPAVMEVIVTLLAEQAVLVEVTGDAPRRPEIDRRRTPRRHCICDAEVSAHAAPVSARVVDLSLGGVFLQMPAPLPRVGSQLRLSVVFPGLNQPVQLAVEVRRHRIEPATGDAGVGARFLSLGPAAGLAIATYLAALQLQGARA